MGRVLADLGATRKLLRIETLLWSSMPSCRCLFRPGAGQGNTLERFREVIVDGTTASKLDPDQPGVEESRLVFGANRGSVANPTGICPPLRPQSEARLPYSYGPL